MRRLMIALVAAGLLASAATGVAIGQGRSSIMLVLLSSTDGLPHWGQQVTFLVHANGTDSPYVDLRCDQGGTLVNEALGFVEDVETGPAFTLSSESWQSGEADCDASLFTWQRNGRERKIASMSFHVCG